jgi:fructokinase
MVKFAGIECGGTSFFAAIAEDEPSNIVDSCRFETTTPEETLPLIRDWILEREGFVSLGIACFGPVGVDPSLPTFGQILPGCPKVAWRGCRVLQELTQGLPPSVTVAFDTDVNAPALSESLALPPSSTVAYYTVGTGVGVGLCVGGKAVHGMMHPEAGHLRLAKHEEDRFEGVCEKHGDCVEGLSTAPALARRAGLASHSELPGLEDDHETFTFGAHALASLVATLVLVVSPHKIVLGGGVMARASMLPQIHAFTPQILNNYIADPRITDPEQIKEYITLSDHGSMSGIIGAITLGSMQREETQEEKEN